ncbi:15627_t:CDS:2, partial [Racocetra fulgida]
MTEFSGSLVDESLDSELSIGGSLVSRLPANSDMTAQALASKKRTLNDKDTNKASGQATKTAQKAEICQLRKSNFTQLELANKFNIGESTVSKILKQQNYWLSIDSNSKKAKSKRDRSAKYPQLEEILSLWILKAEAHHQTITGAIIQRKAFQFAEQLHIDNFEGSEGWLANFKKRFHIKEYMKQEEGASAPINDLSHYHDKLKDVIKNYHPWDIYNCDETAGRKILLLMDQASPHSLEEGFVPSNIKIYYFPSNTTAYLQSCEAGIIWSFKTHYHKLFCENRIIAYEETIESEPEDYELIDLTLPRPQLEAANLNPTDFLPITSPMQANDFINIDNSVETDIMPSDAEIINTVLDRDCDEDEDKEPEVHISYKEVITNINNILCFINQENRFSIDGSFIQKLSSFKKDVVRDSIAKKKTNNTRFIYARLM